MMELSPTATVMLGLLLAVWTIGAAWLILLARARQQRARGSRIAARRMARMIDQSPAVPLLVKSDGAIEGPERLAAWLGLERLPGFLSELVSSDNRGVAGGHAPSQSAGQPEGGAGLSAEDVERLNEAVRRTQKTAAPFRMEVTPPGSRRHLSVRGQYADPSVAPGGAALLWWFDDTGNRDELARLTREVERTKERSAAIVALIEAAPMAMWYRDADLALDLVNRAYVEAVGMSDPAVVIREQIELVDPADGGMAAHRAGRAREAGRPVERMVHATIGGQRRALSVTDLPLATGGVAGFAKDIEDIEQRDRALRATREAQRALFETLSVGVAQFVADRRLAFANQPFRRLFGLPGEGATQPADFNRVLDSARAAGRLPEVRDFPAWRRELGEWFAGHGPLEDIWTLPDGTHLRVAGLPTPDGGLTMLVEDRSEHLAFASARDGFLRTRATMFESVGEALAVFSPDGRMQICNRRFAELWGLADEIVRSHPGAEDVLARIGALLERPHRQTAIGDIIRAATLDRKQRSDRFRRADGGMVEVAGVPLPDGTALIIMRDPVKAAKAERPVRAPDPAEAPRSADQERAAEQEPSAAPILPPLPPLKPQETELLSFLTTIVRARAAAIEARGLTFNLRGDRRSGRIKADREHLGEAIGAVVDAAIAAVPQGGSVLMSMGRTIKGARITIGDDEPAAPDAQEWADLASARRIIEAHGGKLEIRREPVGKDAGEAVSTNATITLP